MLLEKDTDLKKIVLFSAAPLDNTGPRKIPDIAEMHLKPETFIERHSGIETHARVAEVECCAGISDDLLPSGERVDNGQADFASFTGS